MRVTIFCTDLFWQKVKVTAGLLQLIFTHTHYFESVKMGHSKEQDHLHPTNKEVLEWFKDVLENGKVSEEIFKSASVKFFNICQKMEREKKLYKREVEAFAAEHKNMLKRMEREFLKESGGSGKNHVDAPNDFMEDIEDERERKKAFLQFARDGVKSSKNYQEWLDDKLWPPLQSHPMFALVRTDFELVYPCLRRLFDLGPQRAFSLAWCQFRQLLFLGLAPHLLHLGLATRLHLLLLGPAPHLLPFLPELAPHLPLLLLGLAIHLLLLLLGLAPHLLLVGLAPEKGTSYGRNLDSLFGLTRNKLKSTRLPFQDFLMILRFLFVRTCQLPGKNTFIT